MSDDSISREWLIEAVEEGWIKFDTEKDENRFIHLVRDMAPSAQPEDKCGECDAWNKYKNYPPAEPEPIRINLNEPIKVKLTDLGKDIYYHQYDRINQTAGREICKPRFPKEDEHGYTEFQLWYFIELYGMHIGNVIEPLEIVYERRTDE